jgi:hypothetical protein
MKMKFIFNYTGIKLIVKGVDYFSAVTKIKHPRLSLPSCEVFEKAASLGYHIVMGG